MLIIPVYPVMTLMILAVDAGRKGSKSLSLNQMLQICLWTEENTSAPEPQETGIATLLTTFKTGSDPQKKTAIGPAIAAGKKTTGLQMETAIGPAIAAGKKTSGLQMKTATGPAAAIERKGTGMKTGIRRLMTSL